MLLHDIIEAQLGVCPGVYALRKIINFLIFQSQEFHWKVRFM